MGGVGGEDPMRRYLEAFKDHRHINLGNAPGTVGTYVRGVKQFIAFIEGRGLSTDPENIQRADIDDFMKALFVEYSNIESTRAHKLAAIRAFFKFLTYKRILLYNPTEGVPTPKPIKRLPQKFSTKELRRIFLSPDINTRKGLRDLAIMMTIYGAGLRKHELVGLDMGNISDTGAFIYLNVLGKGKKERLITLRRRPAKVLRRWLLERQTMEPQSESVFVSVKGSAARLSGRHIGNILKKLCTQAGIPTAKAFVHKLRATWATDLYDSGTKLLEICAQAGWDKTETAKSYIRISEKVRKKAAIPDSRWRELMGEDTGGDDAETF